MINVTFFNRNKSCGYSIYRVFQNIMPIISKKINVRELYLPSPYTNIIALLKNVLFTIINMSKNDVYHITGDVHYLLYFLPSKKTIVTVHDIMHYSELSKIKKYVWKLLYIKSLNRAAKIVFISEYTKTQVLKQIHIPNFKISVIPNAINNQMTFYKKEFNSQCPQILHIGTLERKNLNRTIKALEKMNVRKLPINKFDV